MVHYYILISITLFFGLSNSVVLSNQTVKEPERTYIMVKPDGLQRGLVNEIIKRFERKGLKLVGMKLINVGHVTHKTQLFQLTTKSQ